MGDKVKKVEKLWLTENWS